MDCFSNKSVNIDYYIFKNLILKSKINKLLTHRTIILKQLIIIPYFKLFVSFADITIL